MLLKSYSNQAWLLQGDVLCAEALNQILVTREGQSRLLAAFIHRVVPLQQTVSTLRSPRSNKISWLATWRDRNIYLHRTHVGMAVQVITLAARWLTPRLTHAHNAAFVLSLSLCFCLSLWLCLCRLSVCVCVSDMALGLSWMH